MKKIRRIIIGLIIALIIGVLGLSGYVGVSMTSSSDITREFGYKDSFTNLKIKSDYELNAYYQNNNKDTTMIFVHGYNSELTQDGRVEKIIKHYDKRFNYLTFDLRAQGLSDGDFITFGRDEKKDVKAVIDYALSINPNNKIFVYGISMGAATSLQTLSIDDRIDLVVVDSPYSDMNKFMDENLSVWTGLPAFPFNSTVKFMTTIIRNFNVNDVDIENTINTKVPILLIHSKDDSDINYMNSQRIFDKIKTMNPNNELYLVEGYKHCQFVNDNPIEYFKIVDTFLDKNL